MPETDGERERDAATLLTHKNEKEIFFRFDHGPTGRRGPHARTSRTTPSREVQVEAEGSDISYLGPECGVYSSKLRPGIKF